METKLKSNHIFVSYGESNSDEYFSKIEFNKSLITYPLSTIKEWIFTKYKVNDDRDLNLFIKHGDSAEKWNVFDGDQPFFTFIFTSDNERDFIYVFEEQLKKELEKQEREEHLKKHPYSPSPNEYDAGVSMDGE